jgi:DNA processing protein
MNNQLYWYALSKVPGIGGATARKLCEHFGTIQQVFEGSEESLAQVPRIQLESIQAIRSIDWEQLESELDGLHEEEVQLLTWEDESYPEPLKSLSDAPYLLYMRGGLMAEDSKAVAIVGTREPSEERYELAKQLAYSLAECGFTIVSGLAMGIDTAAHWGALQATQGRTIAVLGSGIRKVHPLSNRELAGEIILRGAVLSELQPNTPPVGSGLMMRDRLVSGLSQAVIIVQANEKGGSMDTASKATKQKRLVLAVPGSPGTDLLIRERAVPIEPDNPDIESILAWVEQHRRMSGQQDLFNE